MTVYIHKAVTKGLLIILISLITFHLAFHLSENYTASFESYRENYKISNANQTEYLIVLGSLDSEQQSQFINSTEIQYLFDLPKETAYYIYIGYLIICICLILSIQSIKNTDRHD